MSELRPQILNFMAAVVWRSSRVVNLAAQIALASVVRTAPGVSLGLGSWAKAGRIATMNKLIIGLCCILFSVASSVHEKRAVLVEAIWSMETWTCPKDAIAAFPVQNNPLFDWEKYHKGGGKVWCLIPKED